MNLTRAVVLAIHHHNARVAAARAAYNEDQRVEAGLCVTCDNQPLPGRRMCEPCRRRLYKRRRANARA